MLIHIGFPKTASTWLQDYVMKNSEIGFHRTSAGGLLVQGLFHVHPFEFDAESLRRAYDNEEQKRGLPTTPWFTFERLAGHALSGGYDAKLLADRLAAVFPDGKILIIIREQKNLILSNFKQSVKAGAVAPLDSYLEIPNLHPGRAIPRFSFRYFEYHHLIAHYQQLFGSQNVLVLPYELFRQSPKEFVKQVVAFGGLPEPSANLLNTLPFNERPRQARGPIETQVKRYINGFFAPRNEVNPHALFPSKFLSKGCTFVIRQIEQKLIPQSYKNHLEANLKDYIKIRVGNRYQESNQKTVALTDLDLGAYGYDLIPESKH